MQLLSFFIYLVNNFIILVCTASFQYRIFARYVIVLVYIKVNEYYSFIRKTFCMSDSREISLIEQYKQFYRSRLDKVLTTMAHRLRIHWQIYHSFCNGNARRVNVALDLHKFLPLFPSFFSLAVVSCLLEPRFPQLVPSISCLQILSINHIQIQPVLHDSFVWTLP